MSEVIQALPADGGRRKRPGLLFGLSAMLGAGTALSSGITQYLAWRLDYHAGLGSPIVGHIYAPWDWFIWSRAEWASDVPTLFSQAYIGVLLAVGALFAAAVSVSNGRRKPREYSDIYGTARFATPEDMNASGFLCQNDGVYIGGWVDPKGRLHYLRHDGAEHIAAIAPTRSGKGVGLVLPTLLTCLHSAVIYDEKGELWHLTAGWRSTEGGNIVFRWQPGSPTDSCCFNFLDAVRVGTDYEVSDAQKISMMLCDPDGLGVVDHWAKTSYALITGLILHECYKAAARAQTASLPDVADALSDPFRPADKLYEEMVNNKHVNGERHDFIAQEGRAQLNREGKERASVHSSAVTAMSLFRDPIVSNNSRHSDFHILDLMNHDRPVSLYIATPGPDKTVLRPLVRLMLSTIVAGLTGVTIRYDEHGRPQMPHKHRLLLMLDEFPSLGRLRIIEGALATVAGFGIKAYMIMQDREQLIGSYGPHETILSNCHIKIAYAPNQYETARWISGILGKQTVNVEEISESGARGASMKNTTRSIRQIAQELMTPEQVLSLEAPVKVGDKIISAGRMVIWAAGMKARIYGTQILHFLDPVFLGRSRIPAPSDKQTIRNRPIPAFTVTPKPGRGGRRAVKARP